MSSQSDREITDVVICGCGPTGAMLSVFLARHHVRNIVLERDQCINVDPRGIALDEDGIRCLQACGIYDKIFTDIGQCMGNLQFVDGVHNDLSRKAFMAFNYNTTEGGTGHPGFLRHKQPTLEKHLRTQLASSEESDLRLGATLTSIHEDDDWVYLSYKDSQGREQHLQSKFLVGADGKTGFTRKKYMEPRGIRMETASQTPYDETWVALNWKLKLPTPVTHPDFPLWNKGLNPEQVYEAFFPKDFRFLCNPNRPAICSRVGLDEDRLWRFEFVILPGEDGETMSSPEKMRQVVFPYVSHPGSRYGLDEDVQYPNDCIQVLRSRPFNFSAKSCNKWAQDRVILCGDAAHVFPPFGGQGIASGFRDAISLAWILSLATSQPSWTEGRPNHHTLLESWYSERKQQLEKSLASTVENGKFVTEGDPMRACLKSWYFRAIQLVPQWRRDVELGHRREGMTKYVWQPGKGMIFLPELGGGGNFPQTYCVALAGGEGGKVHFTDDVIFSPWKRGLFQVVVLLDSIEDLKELRQFLAGVDSGLQQFLRPDEATFILLDTASPKIQANTEERNIFRLATGAEFGADKVLCRGRPQPQNYDPFRLSKEVDGKRFVILRPDRFVFAACDSQNDFLGALKSLRHLIMGSSCQ